MNQPEITREKSSTIAFVLCCFANETIEKEELRQWADSIISNVKDYPSYILDLSTFEGYVGDAYSVLGFVPDRSFSDDENCALTAISYARGKTPFEPSCTREKAKQTLDRRKDVLAEFKQTFPFINLPL